MTDLKTEFKKHMESCVPSLSPCDIKQGRAAIEYFQKRTRENPFFAIATGALHGSRVSFEPQQRYVEKIMKMDPKELTHDDENIRILKGACKSRKSGSVWLGEGGTIQCCKNE